MIDVGSLFEEAGISGLVVVAFAAFGLFLAVVQLALAKVVELGPVVIASVPITLLAGALGALRELSRAFSALAMVEPDLKLRLAAVGTAEALAPLVIALVAGLVQLFFVSVALTVRANVSRRPG